MFLLWFNQQKVLFSNNVLLHLNYSTKYVVHCCALTIGLHKMKALMCKPWLVLLDAVTEAEVFYVKWCVSGKFNFAQTTSLMTYSWLLPYQEGENVTGLQLHSRRGCEEALLIWWCLGAWVSSCYYLDAVFQYEPLGSGLGGCFHSFKVSRSHPSFCLIHVLRMLQSQVSQWDWTVSARLYEVIVPVRISLLHLASTLDLHKATVSWTWSREDMEVIQFVR